MEPRRIAKVEIDRDKCLSNGYCLDIAEQVFSWDEDDISVVGNIQLADEATLTEAARICPSMAIILKDKDGQEIDPDD